jgi:hypothetical protein
MSSHSSRSLFRDVNHKRIGGPQEGEVAARMGRDIAGVDRGGRRPERIRAARRTARTPRTAAPQGPARMMFALDLIGLSEEIAERLHAHAAFRELGVSI